MGRGKGRTGFRDDDTASIGEWLDADAAQSPTLLCRWAALQEIPGQGQPSLGALWRKGRQEVAAGLRVDRGQLRLGGAQLGVRELLGGLLQRDLRPAKDLLPAGMGQQGSAQHKPAGLDNRGSRGVLQGPAHPRLGSLRPQMAYERLKASVECSALFGGQIEQPRAELVHAPLALPEAAVTEAIRNGRAEAALRIQALNGS